MKRFDQLPLPGGGSDPPKPAPKKERGLPRALPSRLKPEKRMSDRLAVMLGEWAMNQPATLKTPKRDYGKEKG